MKPLKVLAIDYGTQRIGLAISFGTLADPLTVIANDENALKYIGKVISDYSITTVIVGLSENQMAEKTQAFADRLKKVLTIPVEFYDETLSTHSVRTKLQEQNKSQKRHVDHLAAAEFLQEWLDTTDKITMGD